MIRRPSLGTLGTLRTSARIIGSASVTAAMVAAYRVQQRWTSAEQQQSLLDRYRRVLLTRLLRIYGVDLTVLPGAPAPASSARLVVANHRSIVDIAVLLWLFGGYIVSRSDLAAWPLVGTIARISGTIFVDRSVAASRASALQAIRDCLSKGATVVIFPEGGTFEGDRVRPFRSGAFAAAKDFDAEIVTVGLAYEAGTEFGDETFVSHLGNIAVSRVTRVVAYVGSPLRASHDAKTTAEECRIAVQKLVDQARHAFDART